MDEPRAETPPKEPAPQAPLKQIRTFQGDVAEALSRQNESLYSIQAKEHMRGGGAASGEAAPRSALPLFAGSLLLIAVTAFGGYLAYGEFERKTAVPAPLAPESLFLSAESSREVDVSGLAREDLAQAVTDAASGTKEGELRHIVVNATTSPFLAALETEAPGSLVRALEPVFMLGTIGLGDQSLGSSRFLIFKLASFPNAVGGMLAWEESLASDLGP
ncbi:hypothetical protein KW784_01345, partial [Candidatus Parcubacteria bacterium]|nr:hypothetical protein [Candidatus Parcubacteria bacterium]